MKSESDWIKIENFADHYDDYFVTYELNDQTQVEASSDFAAAIDFEGAFFDRYNVHGQDEVETSGGDQTATKFFMDFCVYLADQVKVGEWKISWVTCEDEDHRIDLCFRPGSCTVRVHWDVDD